MNRTVRSVATSLAVGFALYFAARSLWWVPQPSSPLLMIGATLLFLVVVNIAILWDSATSVKMPLWVAWLCVVASALIPTLVTMALDDASRTAPYATSYIGGLGILGVVCIVRRRFLFGWGTLVALVATSAAYLGIGVALNLGLVGSIMWLVIARLLVFFWDRAIRDTERLAEIQQAVSAWHATQLVRQRERRVRTQFALAVAGPVLGRVVASRGDLTEDERLQARLAEGRLRDELRGADLLNDDVRDAIEDARRRGVVVTVFDESGLEGIEEDRRAEIRDELAVVVATARAARLIIRSSNDPRVAVTVVGRARSGSRDDDDVDLFHEIQREPSSV